MNIRKVICILTPDSKNRLMLWKRVWKNTENWINEHSVELSFQTQEILSTTCFWENLVLTKKTFSSTKLNLSRIFIKHGVPETFENKMQTSMLWSTIKSEVKP